ncbi:hypothetical protein [Rubricoccus marinus]|uniref:Uncharacterized protein n=1 Tax=Rubricoccus marinus TaxID=716817 RepID=A0A259TVW1_9BACT|nr:hypothetical protein [Rubricoccus marinus]OZC01688.1 hypothetical protein BSZ36_01030 [Rubricoccus marinus]
MTPIRLRQLGQYDASFEASVDADGIWRVDGGSYVTRGVREGRLSSAEHAAIGALAAAVAMRETHAIPEDARGFTSTLDVGGDTLEWWGPPPTPALRALANALAGLGA